MYWGFDTIALAQFQESCEQKYKNGEVITSEEKTKLENCVWIKLASVLSPSNLVIRQWALIDLFKGFPDHAPKLKKMLDVLSYRGDESGMRIWAEGHYYFWYTMCILQLWVTKFETNISMDILAIKGLIRHIREGLTMTGYYRDGVMYGAPYGDVRDVPLDVVTEIERKDTVKISNVSMNVMENMVTYHIIGRPIGLNLHVPKNDSVVNVVGGMPVGFKFYEGWDKKYRNKWEEICDLMSWKRLRSLI